MKQQSLLITHPDIIPNFWEKNEKYNLFHK